jgi:hypothetical protein
MRLHDRVAIHFAGGGKVGGFGLFQNGGGGGGHGVFLCEGWRSSYCAGAGARNTSGLRAKNNRPRLHAAGLCLYCPQFAV